MIGYVFAGIIGALLAKRTNTCEIYDDSYDMHSIGWAPCEVCKENEQTQLCNFKNIGCIVTQTRRGSYLNVDISPCLKCGSKVSIESLRKSGRVN